MTLVPLPFIDWGDATFTRAITELIQQVADASGVNLQVAAFSTQATYATYEETRSIRAWRAAAVAHALDPEPAFSALVATLK